MQSADLGFLQEWLERQEGGDFFLNRIERGAYDRKFHSDLITVSGMYKEVGFLEQWVQKHVTTTYHPLIGKRLTPPNSESDGMEFWYYSPKSFPVMIDIVCALVFLLLVTLLASFLPSQKDIGSASRYHFFMGLGFLVVIFMNIQRRTQALVATIAIIATLIGLGWEDEGCGIGVWPFGRLTPLGGFLSRSVFIAREPEIQQ